MKRKIAVFLLCLLLCGCTAAPDAAQDETRAPERKAENQSEVAAAPLVPKLSEIPTTHEPRHTNPIPEATEPQAETEPQTSTLPPVPTQPPTPTEKTESTQASSTLPSTAEPIEPAPTELTPSAEPTESPTEPPTEPAFDIDAWVSFAREYAVGLGLVLDSAATSCWDNPILASAQSRYLERDLKGVLEDYASAPDISQVWIWSELRPDGRYDIYIGYA